ncbi:MAG: DNA alkylation repair protein [Minisyncoccia bacterium]
MTEKEIVQFLKKNGKTKNVLGMARFGIRPKTKVYGLSVVQVRQLAKKIGTNHELAQALFWSNIHECRWLAAMIDDPLEITSSQMDEWAKDFDTWDVCDSACMNLFRYSPLAIKKCFKWAKEKDEYYKRAGFALMAALASNRKNLLDDKKFEQFFPVIIDASNDERNYVKKAVNWALRQIGKRNKNLRTKAIQIAKRIITLDTPSARFIGGDALRELGKTHVK